MVSENLSTNVSAIPGHVFVLDFMIDIYFILFRRY